MKQLFIYIIAIFILFCGITAYAQSPPSDITNRSTGLVYTQDYTIYWITTDKNITAAWDAVPEVEGYEVALRWTRGTTILQNYAIGSTTNTTMSFTVPRAGAFVVAVRAYKTDPENTTQKLYSEWAVSNSAAYATVDGVAKAWILMGSLSAPGAPGID